MVDEQGQLYTIEGVAAALIMLFSAYLVISATSVYTPGDTHISDMQLEQLGTDALRMMNTPATNSSSESPLAGMVRTGNAASFNETFLRYVDTKTGSATDNAPRGLHYTASVAYYNRADNETESLPLASFGSLTGGEHPVRVTEWVIADRTFPGDGSQPRAVLVEVLLWRD